MMTVAVVFSAGEARDKHVRAEGADYADDIGEGDVVASPFLESFFGGLRVSEVGDAGEALFDSVVFVGGEEFESAQGAEFVLSALAASQSEEQRLYAFAAGFEGEGAAVFVVGMSDDHHQAAGGLQFAELLFQAGEAD